MEETAQQTSAFPAPPYYFKRYSKENLALLDHVKHATPSELQEDKSITQDIADLGYPLAALEPPPPITSGHYWQFGKPWPYAEKVEQIRLIFINMHHILNEYRPHQAKETLRLMMQEQLERKRRETQALRR
ncbi:Mediator of RNA polymerase II transcription subunit 7 [Actinomortierella ambigua]|nr:Mediator of RNA polymerase II transcription subunit 7 [Actinomortierella ambigua]